VKKVIKYQFKIKTSMKINPEKSVDFSTQLDNSAIKLNLNQNGSGDFSPLNLEQFWRE